VKRVVVADTGPLTAIAEQTKGGRSETSRRVTSSVAVRVQNRPAAPIGPIAYLMDYPTRVRLSCEGRVGAWGSACYAMKRTRSTVSRGSRDAEDLCGSETSKDTGIESIAWLDGREATPKCLPSRWGLLTIRTRDKGLIPKLPCRGAVSRSGSKVGICAPIERPEGKSTRFTGIFFR